MTRKSKCLFSIAIFESPYWGTEQCGPCLSMEHLSDPPGETGNPWTASACSGPLSLTTACQGCIWNVKQVKVISEKYVTSCQDYFSLKVNVIWCQVYIKIPMSHHITVIYMIIYANVTSSENSVSHHLKINQFLGKKQNIIPVFLKI